MRLAAYALAVRDSKHEGSRTPPSVEIGLDKRAAARQSAGPEVERMARFRYRGEPARSFVAAMGPSTCLRFKPHDGSTLELRPTPPAVEFAIGDDLGQDFTDERVLRHLRADPRFEEIA